MSDFSKLKARKNGKEYILNICTQDTEQNIIGTKNFSKLTVNSKNVVTSINGMNADASGNVTINVAAGGTVSLKSTRGASESNWTITGLEVGKPLYIIHSANGEYAGKVTGIRAISGTLDTSSVHNNLGNDRTNVFIVIPTSTTVVLNHSSTYAGNSLRAYQ